MRAGKWARAFNFWWVIYLSRSGKEKEKQKNSGSIILYIRALGNNFAEVCPTPLQVGEKWRIWWENHVITLGLPFQSLLTKKLNIIYEL